MSRSAPSLAAAIAAVALAVAAEPLAGAPYPAQRQGSGTEATAGAGVVMGAAFRPRLALAAFDPTWRELRITLVSRPVGCARIDDPAPSRAPTSWPSSGRGPEGSGAVANGCSGTFAAT
jgi:hypothetical protein